MVTSVAFQLHLSGHLHVVIKNVHTSATNTLTQLVSQISKRKAY